MDKAYLNFENASVYCTVCNKCFSEKHKLKRHMMIHTGEKPFVCRYCGKAFSLEYNLNTHVRVHTGEKPYTCDFPDCGKAFSQAGNLKTHMKTNHAAKLTRETTKSEVEIPKGPVPLTFESLMGKALSDFSKNLE